MKKISLSLATIVLIWASFEFWRYKFNDLTPPRGAAANDPFIQGSAPPSEFAPVQLKAVSRAALKIQNHGDEIQATFAAVFWASWCDPCMKEIAFLANAARTGALAEGAKVYFINFGETDQRQAETIRLYGDHLAFYSDPDGRWANAFRLEGLPSAYFYRDGKYAGRTLGLNEEAKIRWAGFFDRLSQATTAADNKSD